MNEEAVFFQHVNRWLLFQANTPWDQPQAFAHTHQAFVEAANRNIEWRLGSYHIKDYLGWPGMLRYRNIRNIDFEWGWKDPVNTITLDLWMKLFPEARIVNIIRNPLDVASSLQKREKNRIQNYLQQSSLTKREKRLHKKPAYNLSNRVLDLEQGVKLAIDYMQINREHLEKYPQSIQVVYEDLLSEPEKQLSRVLHFLGMTVDNDLLEKATSEIDRRKKYQFTEDKTLCELFESMQLEIVFSEFGFDQPNAIT